MREAESCHRKTILVNRIIVERCSFGKVGNAQKGEATLGQAVGQMIIAWREDNALTVGEVIIKVSSKKLLIADSCSHSASPQ